MHELIKLIQSNVDNPLLNIIKWHMANNDFSYSQLTFFLLFFF